MARHPTTADPALDSLIGELADEFLARLERGERPDPEEFAARRPEAADLIRRVLASLQVLEGQPEQSDLDRDRIGPSREPLGDFRILREVGRGGMGIVYEAEQSSLARRVALKVLPFAATMDARHLLRFKNEAVAAASLDHPHIVKVHAVGQDRGVHYYAMQFIDGQTLADFIRGQQLEQDSGEAASDPDFPEPPTEGYIPESPGDAPGFASSSPAAKPNGRPGPETALQGSTQQSHLGKAYFENAARLGMQAAQALEHAHAMGIVHRDIKPGNLMVDGAGHLWVTDFGLARTSADTGLTMTGDVLGTLRYMSPEQALAKHGLVDHRSDIYALGATLYELLTLRPAVDGKDRQEILNRIVAEEPVSPRTRNRFLPADLETIVLKALRHDPAERYATAGDMAADLQRFLEDRPIQARRPTLVQRLRKWTRRHQTAVAAAFGLLLTTVAVLAGSMVLIQQEKHQKVLALEKAETSLEQKNAALAEARSNLDKADQERRRAEENLRRALSLVQTHLKVGQELEKAGKDFDAQRTYTQLVPILRAAVEQFPGVHQYQDILATTAFNLARIHEARDRRAEAVEAFRIAAGALEQMVPDETRRGRSEYSPYIVVDRLVTILTMLAHSLQEAGRHEEAKKSLQEALRILHAHKKEMKADEEDFREIYWSRLIEAEVGLGVLEAETGDPRRAEELLGATLNKARWDSLRSGSHLFMLVEEEFADGLVHLGETMRMNLRHEEAAEVFGQARNTLEKLTVTDDMYAAQLARFLLTCPDPRFRDEKRALVLMEKRVAAYPKTGYYRHLLGIAHYRLGNWKSAVEELKKADRLPGGTGISTKFHLAMAYHRLHDEKSCRVAYQQALASLKKGNPFDPVIRRLHAEVDALLSSAPMGKGDTEKPSSSP